jgi:hypothetical protein
MNFVTPGGSLKHGVGGLPWVFQGVRTGAMQDCESGLPRISIPRTPVNRRRGHCTEARIGPVLCRLDRLRGKRKAGPPY